MPVYTGLVCCIIDHVQLAEDKKEKPTDLVYKKQRNIFSEECTPRNNEGYFS
jgi:hypothetical protein